MADRILAFRPLGAYRHATADGTIPAVQARLLNTVWASHPVTANRRAVHQRSARKRMRQGIAGGGRHIAPALLLC